MYELYDECTVMFFFRNKHITIDLGTGNNNKINWLLNDKVRTILTHAWAHQCTGGGGCDERVGVLLSAAADQ